MLNTDYEPSRFGWIGLSDDISGVGQNGGLVLRFTVGATALKLGDAVFVSAANTVDKATATTNHAKVIGIVVGGSDLDKGNLIVHQRTADIGTQAAAAAGKVLVAVFGIAYAVSDAAITAGDALVLGTSTAGRVKTATATTASAANPTQAATTQANPTQATTTQANPTQAASTAANPTQAATTQAADSVNAGATPVTSTAANGAIITGGAITNGAITAGAITNGAITAGAITNGAITAGAITNGAITAGAVTLAGDGYTKIFAKALETASGAGEKIRVLIHL